MHPTHRGIDMLSYLLSPYAKFDIVWLFFLHHLWHIKEETGTCIVAQNTSLLHQMEGWFAPPAIARQGVNMSMRFSEHNPSAPSKLWPSNAVSYSHNVRAGSSQLPCGAISVTAIQCGALRLSTRMGIIGSLFKNYSIILVSCHPIVCKGRQTSVVRQGLHPSRRKSMSLRSDWQWGAMTVVWKEWRQLWTTFRYRMLSHTHRVSWECKFATEGDQRNAHPHSSHMALARPLLGPCIGQFRRLPHMSAVSEQC